MQQALTKKGGLYVSTLYSPFDCCGCVPQKIGYKKCGERFAMDNKCCAYGNIDLSIFNLENKKIVGNVKQNKTICHGVKSYDVDFQEDALPLEKLLIISEIFMFVFLKWDEGGNNNMVITRKRRIFPGLNPDFV